LLRRIFLLTSFITLFVSALAEHHPSSYQHELEYSI
jgi:hypothetical protein